MLELCNVNKAYAEGRRVLTNLSYTLKAGEYAAIMGDSGVGKSTLLNLIAGLDTPDSGEIRINGVSISSLDDDAATQLRREQFGFIFQAFHVLPHLTLNQNIALPLLLNGASMDRVEQMLADVGLRDRGHHFPRQLSGGQEQRVSIARAIATDPTLIVADEPTGDLDAKSGTEILDLMERLNREFHKTIIMVTHDPRAAKRAKRILMLEDGKLLSDSADDVAGNLVGTGGNSQPADGRAS